jgi:hypothetical protein
MLVRFRQTAAGLQCSLVETRRIDGKVRYEQVASLGSVSRSPSVGDRLAFWRRVYEQLAELADRIDAETQGQIISAVHSRVPIVTPNEQRALRVRPHPHEAEKAPRRQRAEERPQNEAPKPPSSGTAADSPLPFPLNPALPTMENNGVQPAEDAALGNEQMMQAERGENVEGGVGRPTTVEEFRTILIHLLHHTPFR